MNRRLSSQCTFRLGFYLCLLGFSLALFPFSLRGQTIIGQYQDEAPFRSWNILGIPTATSLGMGQAAFAIASDDSVALVNPALLTDLPSLSLTLSGSVNTASFYRYSIVNTGVLSTEQNSSASLYTLDFAGISATYKGWTLGFSLGLLEIYDRPSQKVDIEFQGQVYYTLHLQQDGLLKNTNISLARRLFDGVALGIGVNFLSGSMEKSIEEEYFSSGITMSDVKSHDFKGFYVNGGLVVNPTDRCKLGIIFRTPFTKKADSQSEWRFHSPRGRTTISNQGIGQSEFKQPLVLGAGMAYRFTEEFRAAADVSYFHWSSYSIEFYDEEMDREFKNIIQVGGGIEYLYSAHLFDQEFGLLLRAGLSYDPQPMKRPNSYYLYYTLGTGVHWHNFHLDAGLILGSEKGSDHDLTAQKFSISLSYHL